jgi:type I restriction enzyme, S subunit
LTRKKGLVQRLLGGEVRFEGFDGEWEELSLGEMGHVSNDGTPSTIEPTYWEGDIQWASPTDLPPKKLIQLQC